MNLAQENQNNITQAPVTGERNKFKYILSIAFLLIGVTLVVGIFLIQRNKTELQQFPVDTDTEQNLPFNRSAFDNLYVGQVRVTLKDVERKFNLKYEDTPENVQNIENWKQALLKANEDAILQNEGIQQGLYDTNQDLSILDPDKVNTASDYFDTKGKRYISGETVTLWYFNTMEPPIGKENAKKIALQRISDLNQKVKSGELTMQEAAQNIKDDTALAQVDPSHINNAYARFSYISPNKSFYHDDRINQLMWQAQIGEVSDVINGYDFSGNEEYDAYYTFFVVNEKNSESPYSSSQDLIQQKLNGNYRLEL